MARVEPPRWTVDELDAGRQQALSVFIASWGTQGTQRYRTRVAEYSERIAELFDATENLTTLSGATFTADARLVEPARFLTAPPVSADDLKTLIGGSLSTKNPDPSRAERAAQIVRTAWDPIRFGWIADGRKPSPEEVRTAVLWTASIWAIESMRTHQRMTSARTQEELVASTLEGAGFLRVGRGRIESLEDVERGTFTPESRIGNHKSDVPVRLRDGRLMAIECKVSNSAVNSKKRLNNDVGAKAADWQRDFGNQVITVAVLSGVYSLGNLTTAQENQHIVIFWSHDLRPLVEFVTKAV